MFMINTLFDEEEMSISGNDILILTIDQGVHPIVYDKNIRGDLMYKISEFAEITGLSKETLRYYAEIKLLEPAYIDPHNHYRYYDDGSFFLAALLVKLRSFGLTIQEMQGVMNDESFFNLEALLLKKRKLIVKQMEDLQERIVEIDAFIQSGREEQE